MRIVSRKEFVGMPAGTLYSEFEPCVFGGLRVKGDTLPAQVAGGLPDFECTWPLAEQIDVPAEDWGAFLTDPVRSREGVGMRFGIMGRDGGFDPTQMFAVYDATDLDALIRYLGAIRSRHGDWRDEFVERLRQEIHAEADARTESMVRDGSWERGLKAAGIRRAEAIAVARGLTVLRAKTGEMFRLEGRDALGAATDLGFLLAALHKLSPGADIGCWEAGKGWTE